MWRKGVISLDPSSLVYSGFRYFSHSYFLVLTAAFFCFFSLCSLLSMIFTHTTWYLVQFSHFFHTLPGTFSKSLEAIYYLLTDYLADFRFGDRA